MKENLYLTCSLNNYLYGINTDDVQEILALPELTLIPDAPDGVVGIINLRGDTLPIVDLNVIFGHQSPDYCLTDSLIVLSWQETRIGIIVNNVQEVKNISWDEITNTLDSEQELIVDGKIRFIIGVTRFADHIFILNNPNVWFNSVETEQILSLQNPHQQDFLFLQQPVFCPNATLEERKIFKQRADNLRLSIKYQDLKSFTTLAVIALNGYLFGIDLDMVREFTDIRQVTPIPCCPAHIIGNMNLRGEILTLIDLRGLLLNLPPQNIANSSKAMVVEVEGIVAGIIVEEVCDVMFSLDLQKVMTAFNSINDEYFQGAAPYHDKMMNILNMPNIFLKGGLIVDEAI